MEQEFVVYQSLSEEVKEELKDDYALDDDQLVEELIETGEVRLFTREDK